MNRSTRMLARFAALSVLIGLGLTAGNLPASASDSNSTFQADLWAYTDSHDPKASFVKQTGDLPLGTHMDADNEAHTSRFYFTIDIASLRGMALHWVTVSAQEKSVVDCNSYATVELWRTTEITDQTSWDKPPTELEQLGSTSTYPWWCPSSTGFAILNAVEAALARHEVKITFEYRLAAKDELNPAMARTYNNRPVLNSLMNVPPTVSNPIGPDGTCASLNQPTPVSQTAVLAANGDDPDHSGSLIGDIAVWPVDQPDQKYTTDTFARDGMLGPATVSLTQYAEGTVLGWAMRSDSWPDYSDWTQPCYLVIDRTAPAQAPIVASPDFVESTLIQSGGTGVPGEFRFDAQGDRDVAAFSYSDGGKVRGTVPASHPGGKATVTYTPTSSGVTTLSVWTLDAAGNAGPSTKYTFYAAWTAPNISVDRGGVGLPSHITMSSSETATDFSYQIETGPEVKFPAVSGSGTAELTFTHTGNTSVVARTYDHNTLLGATTYYVMVSDAPKVTSDEFSFQQTVVLGETGTFTFRPFTADVVAYRYSFNGGAWQTVDAQPDGTAALTWTATIKGWVGMRVSSIRSDGSVSEETWYNFRVLDPHPTVWPDVHAWPRRDGVGLPLSVALSSEMPNVSGYAYTFNGGSEQTVSGGSYVLTTVTPDHPGDNTIVVQAIYADGTRSPNTTLTFQVTNAPIVSWNGDAMMPGDTATFSVGPALSGVTGYRYAFDSTDPTRATQTATANSDGTLSLPWLLGRTGYHSLEIASTSADGTTSDFRIFQFVVSDPTVSVNGFYNGWRTNGGAGVPGWVTFYSQMWKYVVDFEYQLNDGPVQTVAIPEGSIFGTAVITPPHSGANTLTVRALMADGRYSPVTTSTLLVGTAPHVESMEYPAGQFAGAAGVTGTFAFSGGTAGIAAFDYQVSDGTSAEVTADASGTAMVQWTPASAGTYTMTVRGKLADGTLTDQATYYIYVQSS